MRLIIWRCSSAWSHLTMMRMMQMKTLVMVIMMLMMMSLIVLTTGQRWVARPTTCLSLIESLSGPVKDEPGTFKVEIENEPKYYVPYERYVVILRSVNENQKFKEFNLVVEPVESGANSVGKFQRLVEALTKFSDDCPNGLVQSSSLPKNEIRVMWVAPASGSGCVRFRATVLWKEEWYGNSDSLSYSLCEESFGLDGQPPLLRVCGACEEAKYELTLTGLWSRHTHPKHFPANVWDASISDLVGASHSPAIRLFVPGQKASDPMRLVAEEGNTKPLTGMLSNSSNTAHIRTIIKARGLSHPSLNGQTFAVFRVDPQRHLMSLVAKLIPSPDWFLGVDSLELCLANGSWIEEKQLNVYLWDAGTDGGVSYRNAQKFPLQPTERIRQISSQYPPSDQSPFFDLNQTKVKPFARIRVHRQQVYSLGGDCVPGQGSVRASLRRHGTGDETDEAEGGLGPGETEEDDLLGLNTPYKAVGSLGAGQGHHYESTNSHPDAANTNEQLNNAQSEHVSINAAYAHQNDQGDCGTTEWSEWSPCEIDGGASCGPGQKHRTRHLLDALKLMDCAHRTQLTERQLCLIPCSTFQIGSSINSIYANTAPKAHEGQSSAIANRQIGSESDLPSPVSTVSLSPESSEGGVSSESIESESVTSSTAVSIGQVTSGRLPSTCKVSDWSDWSSCFGDCDLTSYANRTRTLLTFRPECLHVPLVQQRVCDRGCRLNGVNAQDQARRRRNRRPTRRPLRTESSLNDVCRLPIVENDCGSKLIRYFYDFNAARCRRFIYQGCFDYGNRFASLKECQLHCPSDHEPDPAQATHSKYSDRSASIVESSPGKPNRSNFSNLIYNSIKWRSGDRCETSDWSDWSECFTCSGYRLRFRELRYPDQYTHCSTQLIEKRNCSEDDNPNCQPISWSSSSAAPVDHD